MRSHAHNAQVAHTLCSGSAHSAQVVGASCHSRYALLSAGCQVAVHCAHLEICSSVLVTTPRPGRDLLPLPIPRPSCDIISKSRPPGRPSQVVTSIPCRDLLSAQHRQTRSRPQNGVATPMAVSPPATPKTGRRPSQVATPIASRDSG